MKAVTPEGYLPRIVSSEIKGCLRFYGAVEITGAKWYGKAWTAHHHAQSIAYFDELGSLDIALNAPQTLLDGANPRVIDEWQLTSQIWGTVRHAVDDAGQWQGLWVLTGSSAPDYSMIRHSGAEWIGRVRMSPMLLSESGDSLGAVSFSGLPVGSFTPCRSEVSPANLAACCVRDGWPGNIRNSLREALQVARNYLKAATTISTPAQGRGGAVASRLLRALTYNVGQSVTHRTLISDMYGPEDTPEKPTLRTIDEYVDMLDSFYLIEQISGWAPPARPPGRF